MIPTAPIEILKNKELKNTQGTTLKGTGFLFIFVVNW